MTPRQSASRAPRVIAWSSTRPRSAADAWQLDLGDVRETARVTLNGKRLATAWSLPFKVRLDGLKARGNVLEIEVTNLPANRIRDLDVRKVPWKIMREINLVSVKYRPFDAAAWEVEPVGPARAGDAGAARR